MQKFVLQWLYATKGFDINAELAKYEQRYALEIDGLTEKEQRQYLLEELTADSMFGVFSNKKAVELYARKQPKDAKKVAKAISNFLAKVRSALETLAFRGLGSVSALQQQYDTLDEISRQFFAALEAARINRQQNKNTAGNGDVEIRYSRSVEDEYAEYDKPITTTDVKVLRTLGRKHISDFTHEDLTKAKKWAAKYNTELKIKSPFFRSWFGDWREYELAKIEIASIPEYIASNDARKKNRGNFKNHDTGWDIIVSREGETNTISHSGNVRMSEFGLAGIKGLIENAVLLDTEVHEHHTNNAPNETIAFDHKFYALGKNENGNIGLYKITVEEYYQSKSEPNNKKFHNLKYIKKIAEDIGGRTFDKNRSGGSTNDISTTFSIADLFALVKKFDNDFAYNAAHLVMLNEDGTPKIFYHGTNADFYEFDPDKSDKKVRLNKMGSGNYFSARKIDAEHYGKNVMQCYIRSDNPYIKSYDYVTIADQVVDEYGIDRSLLSGDRVREILEEKGFDAVVQLDQHEKALFVNIFSSEQIKSVDENIGVFDRTTKDIRFSNKLSSDTQDYVTRLQQENEDLQAAVEAAKAELKETRGLTISDKELRKISDFFADTLQSDMSRDELFKALRGYFNYAADGGDLNVVLGTMTDLYLEAMQTSKSEMLWTELYDGQKEVLDDLRTNPVYLSEIQVQTVESNFDGYKNFQRGSFGKIRFIKNHDGNSFDAKNACNLKTAML